MPGQITTDKIVSGDGNSYIDLINNSFRIGDNSSYLAWNVISGLLQIMNADVVANGKFSTKDPSDNFRLDFEDSSLDVFSLDSSDTVGGVDGSIVGYNVDGSTIFSPTAIIRSKYGTNTFEASGMSDSFRV